MIPGVIEPKQLPQALSSCDFNDFNGIRDPIWDVRWQLHYGNITMVQLRGPMTKAIVLVSFLFGACEVGEVPTNQQGTVDSGGTHLDSGGVLVDAANLCATRVAPAAAAHIHTAGQTTHAGEGCVEANCHSPQNLGTGATGWQFAGTLYGLTSPTSPNVGATVTFTSAGGMTAKSVTDTAGNFYVTAGTLPNPFPVKTEVTVCPNTTPMTGAIVQGGGDCNSAGCHGGTQGPIKLDPLTP